MTLVVIVLATQMIDKPDKCFVLKLLNHEVLQSYNVTKNFGQ